MLYRVYATFKINLKLNSTLAKLFSSLTIPGTERNEPHLLLWPKNILKLSDTYCELQVGKHRKYIGHKLADNQTIYIYNKYIIKALYATSFEQEYRLFACTSGER